MMPNTQTEPPDVKAARVKIEKAHIAIMKHPETCQYGQVAVTGKTFVDEFHPTACTNGFDTHYNHKFISGLSQKQTTGVVLHEILHKVLKHTTRLLKAWREDQEVANAAADYVVNGIIHSIQDKGLCELPDPHLHAPEFKDWSFNEVYAFLRQAKQQQQQQGGGGQGDGDEEGDDESEGAGGGTSPGKGKGKGKITAADGKQYGTETLDGHDFGKAQTMTSQEIKEHSDAIDQALQQGGLLAGRFGAKIPRAITEMLEPKIDWREVLRDFVSNAMKGTDDYTWRKLNRRYIADDYYMPTTESETVGEIIKADDTSASITQKAISASASELSSICEMVEPERVRQLWWDTQVHGEQVFEPGQYGQIRELLKPMGFGGTHAGCVSEYLKTKEIKAQCVIVMTDGYTEQPIAWDLNVPTLWMVTGNKSFQPPAGHKMVMIESFDC